MSSNLAISLVIGASVGAAVSGINQLKTSLATLKDSSKSISERLKTLSDLSVSGMKASIGSVTALGGSITALAAPAIKFESAMADVKKVVDFDTPDGFKKLSKDLLDLTDTIPMTAEELAAIAASGGQLGVAEKDLKSFTTTIAKMSVAFDMSADESGDAMAKLANVYKIPIGEISKLGDAINHLSNNSPAKARDIVNTLGRIGGVAKQFGLTENAATSLTNTFISLGKSPEVAGTAINGMLTKLMTADKGGKKFQAALKEVGISAKSLKKAIAKDGEAALVSFLKTIEKVPKEKQMGILVDLFGLEYADDVAVIAGNVGEYEKNIKALSEVDANGKPKYLDSMEKEFEARSATTENSLRLLKGSFTKLGISIGSYLLPIINNFVSWLQPIVLSISSWVSNNTEIMGFIAKWGSYIAAAIGGFSVFMGVLSSVTFASLKAFSVFKGLWSILSFGGSAIAFVCKGFGQIAYIITKLLMPIILKLALGFGTLIGYTIKAGLFALNLGKVLAGALYKGLLMAGKAVLMLGRAMLTNPIGIAVTVIAGLAYLIWDNWEWLSGAFSGLWTTISSACSSAWNAITGWCSTAWENIKGFFGNVTATILNWSPLGLFYRIFQPVMSWFGVDLPSSFSDFGKNIIDGLVNGIRNAWEGTKKVVTELGSGIKNWFAEKLGIHSPSRVFMGYGDNISHGLAIGVAQTAVQAGNAVLDMGQQMKNAAPKTLDAPVMKPIKAAKLPKTTAPKVAKTSTNVSHFPAVQGKTTASKVAKISTPKTPTAVSAPVSAKNERLQYIARMQAQDKLQSAVKFEPVLNTIDTIAKPLLSDKKGLLGSLWDDIKFGVNFVGNLLGLNQSSLKTPDFNPNAKISPTPSLQKRGTSGGIFSDYEPLNRNAVTHNETHQNQGSIIVNFNPTINVNGNGPQGVTEQVQQGVQVSLYELERMMNRILDQRQRRAYS